MSERSKRFGGIKKQQGKTPAASADSVPPRKFGGVKNPVPRGAGNAVVESCPQNCPGEWVEGMWIHSYDCPWASVLWFVHGATWKDWRCLYDCEPIELPSGLTHPYTCPFWDRTGKTPFDHSAPIVSGLSSEDYADAGMEPPGTVKEQKERIRRGETQEINTQDIMDSLTEDDLPF